MCYDNNCRMPRKTLGSSRAGWISEAKYCMLWKMAIRYKWVALPVLTLGLGLSWLGFAAQGQLLPSGGLLSSFMLLKSLSALRTIDTLSYSLSGPIKELQVGGGLLVPSLSVRRLWLLAGRVWFFERWFWACAARWRIGERLSSVVPSIHSLSRSFVNKLSCILR